MTSQGRRSWVSVLAAMALMLAQDAGAQNPAPASEGGSSAPAQWQTVAGSDRGFSADMPAAPTYSSVQMKTAAGSVYTMHQYLLEQGNVAFVVQTAAYPDDINVSNPRANLQGGLDNAAKGMEGGKWISIDWRRIEGW